jgi:hypothetical protein
LSAPPAPRTFPATVGILAAGAVTIVSGCAGGPPMPPIPAGFRAAPPADAVAWADSTRPAGYLVLRFRWSYNDGRGGGGGGPGVARIAPPDSLEFDYSGSFGFGRGSAVVVGDSIIWARPEDKVRDFVPNFPLMWAMLGVAVRPSAGAAVSSVSDDRVRAWRYAAGADTLDLVETRLPPRALRVLVRQAGRAIGDAVTEFDAGGRPRRTRLRTLVQPTQLDITFTDVRRVDSIPTELWHAPAQP